MALRRPDAHAGAFMLLFWQILWPKRNDVSKLCFIIRPQIVYSVYGLFFHLSFESVFIKNRVGPSLPPSAKSDLWRVYTVIMSVQRILNNTSDLTQPLQDVNVFLRSLVVSNVHWALVMTNYRHHKWISWNGKFGSTLLFIYTCYFSTKGRFRCCLSLSRQKIASWRVRNLIMRIVACHLVMRFAVHSSLSSSALIRIWAASHALLICLTHMLNPFSNSHDVIKT